MPTPLAYSARMASPACLDAPAGVPSDEELMLAYGAGDAAAFDRLYAKHRSGVYRYLLRHCGIAGTADELFQEVWLSVVRARVTYAPTAKFATWLYRIAHNRVVDHWRATGHLSLVHEEGDEILDGVSAHAGDPAHDAEVTELRDRLQRALAALPPLQRDAFLLHQESGLALADIAELTGAGIETVKSRLRYASARLRALLGDMR